MIEVIVSDLGQVILPFSFEPSKAFMRERCPDPQVDPWQRMVALHERMGFGVGRCATEEFFEAVRADIGLQATLEEFCDAWCDVFWEDERTIALLRRARAETKVLLSNTNAIHWDGVLPRHPAAVDFFDHMLASQNLGLEKPAPEVYRHIERLTGKPSSAHLMIDDLAANVEGARACGWDGIVHTDADRLEVELRARGLID